MSISSSKEIDESLYSRQLYVMGHEAQKKMSTSSVFIAGLNALGVETAKNIILAGVNSVTLYDEKNTTYFDLSGQFYLTEANLNQKRSIGTVQKLSELNPYVEVHHLEKPTNFTGSEENFLLSHIQSCSYTAVVLIDQSVEACNLISEYCHNKSIAFLTGEILGVSGQIFCDFGPNFIVHDHDGESPFTSMIANISREEKGLVTVLEETRHNLSTGDVITLSDIYGMVELNGKECRVEVKDPFSFEIDVDTRTFTPYERSGYVTQVKQPVSVSFSSYNSIAYSPSFENFVIDIVKMDKAPLLHLLFLSIQHYKELNQNQLPRPGSVEDANNFYQFVRQFNQERFQEGSKLDDKELESNEIYIKKFALASRGVLSPIASIIGGILGQEILKACSGKFMPIKQFFYYEATECLPEWTIEENGVEKFFLTPEESDDLQPINCRYDGQIVVFGKAMQEKLSKLNLFLVGAGAIGCEMLKNWAMMGVAAPFTNSSTSSTSTYLPSLAYSDCYTVGPSSAPFNSACAEIFSSSSSSNSSSKSNSARNVGTIHVTDMDSIEKSNLSRQFLFRNSDINQFKSSTAIRAIKSMNPTINAQSYEHKVGTETEDIFNDDFYESQDMIITALDNVEARLYIDQKCVFYRKPMLESGTLGAKGHTQVIVPDLTENYGAQRDPPEKSIPVCTLKHFPNQIDHTIQWSREVFEEIYTKNFIEINEYKKNPSEFFNFLNNQQNLKLEILNKLKKNLTEDKPSNFYDCLVWSRKLFEDNFANKPKQLLHNFPLDRMTSAGTPFWSGSKKPPAPIDFNINDELHREFIVSSAILRASLYNIPVPPENSNEMNRFLNEVVNFAVETFQPQEGIKIAVSDEENEVNGSGSRRPVAPESASHIDKISDEIISSLPSSEIVQTFSINSPLEFEKDDDLHMRFITSCSNLRARNYSIPEADLHTTRGIAGKIVPAIATTTALVTGIICLELYKLVLKDFLLLKVNNSNSEKRKEKLLHKFKNNYYLNSFINLALPFFTSMIPEAPRTINTLINDKKFEWNLWDRFDINNKDMTLDDFIEFLEENFSLELSMLSSGVTILFSDFMDKKKLIERKALKMDQLIELVTKKKINPNQKFLVLEIIVNDADSGDDKEVPYVRFRL